MWALAILKNGGLTDILYIPYLITNLGVFRKEFSTSSARKENGGGGVHPEVAIGTFNTPKRVFNFWVLQYVLRNGAKHLFKYKNFALSLNVMCTLLQIVYAIFAMFLANRGGRGGCLWGCGSLILSSSPIWKGFNFKQE